MAIPWISSTPFTYAIGYDSNLVGNAAFFENVSGGRPGTVHVGHDVPLNTVTGDTVQFTPEDVRYIAAEDMPARIAELREFVAQIHKSGARQVIPYLCPMIIIGDPEARKGFWNLFDRWEEFASLGLGPKPELDPIEWMQTKHGQFLDTDLCAYEPTISYAPWRRYLQVCTRLVAECGYDGTFLDVNTLIGTSEIDRCRFVEYMDERYSADALAERFGFDSPDAILLGKPGDGLLWVETQRFHAWAFGKLFAELRDAGREHVPDFFVLPNNSPLSTIDTFYGRRIVGHGLNYVRNGCDTVMFEEMQQPGRFGMDRICDNIFQHRYALAHGMKSVHLLYHAGNPAAIDVMNAEAAANGGGANVQPGFSRSERTRYWGEWFDRYAEYYDATVSLHDVGILFFAEQMYWDNRAHVEAVYRLRQALSDRHMLFDLIVEPHLTMDALRSFEVVIVPETAYLSEGEIDLLVEYASGGGRLVLVGKCGTHTQYGEPCARTLRERLRNHVDAVDAVDSLVPSRAPELFDLTEDEYNDFEFISALADRVSSPSGAEEARNVPLVPLLERLAGRRLRVLADGAPYTLRVGAFRAADSSRLIVHLVNYDLPVVGKGKSGEPIPARNVRIELSATEARWWTPEGIEGDALSTDGDGITVPEVRTYAMIELGR